MLTFPLNVADPVADDGWQDAGAEIAGEPDGPDVATGPLVALEGGQMAWHDQTRAALAHAYRIARLRSSELQRREGGMVRGLLDAQPGSVQDQRDYAKSRAWVPAGHDGGIAEWCGVIYHALIGRPAVAFFNACSAIFARPLRLALAVLILGVVTVIMLTAF